MQENERREKTVPAEFMAGTKDYADFTLTHVIVSSSSLKRRQGERRPDPGVRCPEIRTAERTAQEKTTPPVPVQIPAGNAESISGHSDFLSQSGIWISNRRVFALLPRWG